MTLSMDNTLEFSTITRLSSQFTQTSFDNEATLNTMVIHPLASVTLDDCSDMESVDGDSVCSSSDSSSSEYSISEGHTHSLSPSTHHHEDTFHIHEKSQMESKTVHPIAIPCTKPRPNTDPPHTIHRRDHSNHYKHLEQQMIQKQFEAKQKLAKPKTKPIASQNNKEVPSPVQTQTQTPIHPPNIITYYQPYHVPSYATYTPYEYNPHLAYYQSYPQNYVVWNTVSTVSTPPYQCDPYLNASTPNTASSQTTLTPVYTTTPTTSSTTTATTSNTKYWDIAQSEGDKYPLHDFAAQHFQVCKHQKSSLFRSNPRHHTDMKFLTELFSFAPFRKMKHSLLKMECGATDKIGQQIWKHMNSYMGVRKSSKSRQTHVENILNIGLHSKSVLRDEIFCQIVKQTNCNESKKLSIDKLLRGWQLMCICCSVLCPSSVFVKYLASYLLDHTTDHVYGDGQVSRMAIFALNALDESMKTGQRKVIPNAVEMSHIEKCQSIPIKIHFLNDTCMTMLVAPQTTVQQLAHAVSNTLKLKHSAAFGLYEMEQIPLQKYCEHQLKRYNSRLDMSYDEKVRDLEKMPIDRHLESDERIMDVVSAWKRNRNIRVVFRYKLFNKYQMDEDLYGANEWKLIAMNEQYNVVRGKYRINSQNDLLHLAAIQLHANNEALSEENVFKYVPHRLCKKYGAQICKELILKAAHSITIATQKQAWMYYIQYLCQLHDAYLFVGCCFFGCIHKRKQNDLIVGINDDSLLIINPITKQIIDRYKLEEILTYGYKSDSFIFVAGTLLKQIKYQFATKHGKEMNDMLHQYIDMKSSD